MPKLNFLELFRFASVGVLNTGSTLIVIYGLMRLNANVYLANLIGYAVGLLISFALNKRWTFRMDEKTRSFLVAKFLITVCVAYLANLLMVYVCISVGNSSYWAQLAGMPAYTICFYFGSKLFVFRNNTRDRRHLA